MIEDYIGHGKDQAVTREWLRAALNLPDRAVRKLIADARDRGVPIINDQDGVGYYITDDVSQLRRQYYTNRRRAMSILRQQKYLRRRISEIMTDDQITIDGW